MTTQPHLAPRLGLSRATPLSLCAFIAYYGETFTSTFTHTETDTVCSKYRLCATHLHSIHYNSVFLPVLYELETHFRMLQSCMPGFQRCHVLIEGLTSASHHSNGTFWIIVGFSTYPLFLGFTYTLQ
jgi:hypothetical protein